MALRIMTSSNSLKHSTRPVCHPNRRSKDWSVGPGAARERARRRRRRHSGLRLLGCLRLSICLLGSSSPLLFAVPFESKTQCERSGFPFCSQLLQKQYKLITPGASVLDLGCSHGAWLQDQKNLCGCGEFDERSSDGNVSSGSEEVMDEKWKLSRKGHSGRNGRIREDGKRSTAESLSRRGANLVKEQRAKFYIMRRCVAMLICWRD